MVLSALAATAAPAIAFAQDTNPPASGGADDTAVSEVVITGVRASLKSAQQLKRDADTVVDSITATDIGQFPDKSVAEALQRVAGITVNRFAASDDTSHFSAEPSGVIVRGLQQVRSELNGRDIFNANSSRGLSFGDVSPELMAGVDSYKNLTADLIEGGIAGTINLRTRVPFDAPGQVFAITGNASYGDIAKSWRPDVSALYSNRWDTGMGEFGLLADLALSKVQTETNGLAYGRLGGYQGFTGPATDEQPHYPQSLVWIPSSIAARDTVYDRTRTGMALAGQWRSNDHKILVTGQYQSSKYHNVWHEHGVAAYPGYSFYGNSVNLRCTPTEALCGGNATLAPQPAPGTPAFTFDDRGLFTSGVMTTDIGWWGNNATEAAAFASNGVGQNLINPCYGWNGCTPSQRGPDFNAITRYNDNREKTADASLNLKWDPTDNIHFQADYQHIHSTVDNYDMEVGMYSYANVGLDQTDGAPKLTLLPGTNVNYAPGGLANPMNYYFHHAMDHLEDSSGDEDAFRADVEYDVGNTWIDSIKMGVRYADRDQTVRWSNYNWANIANNWTSAGPGGIPQSAYFNVTNTTPAGPFTGYAPNLVEMFDFGNNFYRGNNLSPTMFPFFNMGIESNHEAMSRALGAPSIGVGSWNPICSHTGARANELPGSCFTQAETNSIEEKTEAAYVMLKFGGPDAYIGGFRISGNIGLRYVTTKEGSTGGIALPLLDPNSDAYACRVVQPPAPGAPAQPSTPYTIGCYLFGGQALNTVTGQLVNTGLTGSAQDIAFTRGQTISSETSATHHNLLPSFNLKINVTDDWIVRFAASRAMSRPDIGLLKNYTGVSVTLPQQGHPETVCGAVPAGQPCFIANSAGVITGVQPYYSATAYNPYLKPVTADQFDVTLEHYFGDVGQFTVNLFYKKFHDYIQYGSFDLPVTAGGTTRTVAVRGPVNAGGASIKGFELAYQRFFDFLPGPFDGLGMQANFTYVKNSGISNANLHGVGSPNPTTGSDPNNPNSGIGVPDQLNPGALEALSKYAYNVIAMYEKGPWALRAAYNWRSKFLVTALDCCTYLPMWQASQGFLDASVRYKVNDHLELNLEGNNLLNTKTVLKQQVTDASEGRVLLPASWFENDRRVQMGFRLKY